MEANRSPSPPPIRFGVFELDTSTGELRKQGFRIRLHGQPVEILRLLLEKAGAVVTRQELRERLWPGGVHVDFDRSVNKAFVKLREALGDDAASPRFIETLPRVGYRFIAPVEPAVRAVPEVATPDGPKGKRRRKLAGFFGAALAIAASVVLIVQSLPSAPPRVLATIALTRSADTKWGPLLASRTALYFNREGVGRVEVMRLPISGGEPTLVETPFPSAEVFDVSADGTELLVGEIPADPRSASGEPLWIVPAAGGSGRRVGDVRAAGATWSPDGRIVYMNDSAIAAVSRDGAGRREILRTTGEIDWARVSPDGRSIRFHRETDKELHIWEVGTDGSRLRRAFSPIPGVSWECCGTWTRDGRAFVFQAGGGGGRSDLWIAIGRRPPSRFTAGPMNVTQPAVAEAGSRIFAIGVQPQGELVRWDAAVRRFEPFLGGISGDGVSFSADGAWMTYTSFPEGILYRSRADGSERVALTSPPFKASLPQLSPDGKRIAFIGYAPQREPRIFVVDSDGGAPAAVLPGERNAILPAWSPDGRSLAFSGHLLRPAGIRILDLATGNVRVLPESSRYAGPFWSHDGRFLLAAATSPSRIVRFEFAKQEWSEVIRTPFNYASISRNDKFVYYDTRWERDPAVYRVPVAGGAVERVADLRGLRRAVGVSGMWFDLAPDDSPLVLRDTSSRQIYAIDWSR